MSADIANFTPDDLIGWLESGKHTHRHGLMEWAGTNKRCCLGVIARECGLETLDNNEYDCAGTRFISPGDADTPDWIRASVYALEADSLPPWMDVGLMHRLMDLNDNSTTGYEPVIAALRELQE